MRVDFYTTALASCLVIVVVGAVAVPLAFRGRILPGVAVGTLQLGGVRVTDAPARLAAYAQGITQQPLTVSLRGVNQTATLGSLGLQFDIPQTLAAATSHRWLDVIRGERTTAPKLLFDETAFRHQIQTMFAGQLKLPRNASFTSTGGQLVLVPSQSGEGADAQQFRQDIQQFLKQDVTGQVALTVIAEPAAVQDNEVEAARQLATDLVQNGFSLTTNEDPLPISGTVMNRLVVFVPQPDMVDLSNEVLGVQVNTEATQEYLTKTAAPSVERPAQDARFEVVDGKVQQFALPQVGRVLNVVATTEAIQTALAHNHVTTSATIAEQQPAIADVEGIQAMGVTDLLATGESDFTGSPVNRTHNVTVGAAHYNGLLIPPGQEFSFDQVLGPVDASTGYKPELVIKGHQTLPEFGGGLCQVSTTLFRAAVYAGLPITDRKNHAYVVKYYGKPGFDATIYPFSADLKFKNDTPGYILLQSKIEGKKLTFQLWGTKDNRQVEVTEPQVYDRQSNGAMRAVFHQTVTKEGAEPIDHAFYSKYNPPALYPHPVADPPAPTPAPTSGPAPVTPPV